MYNVQFYTIFHLTRPERSRAARSAQRADEECWHALACRSSQMRGSVGAARGRRGRWLPRAARGGRGDWPPLARSRQTRSLAAPRRSRRTRASAKLLVRCERRGAAELLVPRPPRTWRPSRRPSPPGATTGLTPRPPRAAQGGRRPRPLRLLVRRERALRPLLARGRRGRQPPRPALARGERGCGGRGRPSAREDVGPPGRKMMSAAAAIAAEEEVGLLLLDLAFSLNSALSSRSVPLPIARR